MADVTVDSTASTSTTKGKFLWGPYWADDSVGAIVAISGSDDPSIYRTTNGGASWTETALDATSVQAVAAWYDAETPGLTTKLLHMVWPDIDNDSFDYLNLNLETGVYSNSGTPYTIAATGISFGNSECFVTRTRNGNLIAGMYESVSGPNLLYRSTDTGAHWTSRTTVYESTSEDECLGVTVNTGDDADAGVVYWDHSADEISIKVYDDSANTWNETSVSGSMVNPTIATYRNFSVATFRSNGKAFLAAFNDLDGTTPDLKTWLLDITSVTAGAAGVTAKTDVLSNTDEAACPAVFIDPRTDAIYVNYLTGSAFTATVNPFYKVSTDTGSTWGSAVALSDALEDDYRALSAGGTCFSNGGKNMPAWYDDDDRDIFTSLFADVMIISDEIISVSNIAGNGEFNNGGGFGPYWITPSKGAAVFIDSSSDLRAAYTTDGGATWTAPAAVEAGNIGIYACFFDGQTPGNTGTKIHCAWVDNTSANLSYASFDVDAATWSAIVDINASVSISGGGPGAAVVSIAGTRALGFVVTYVNSGGASPTSYAYKSADGSSWSSIANPYESNAFDLTLGVSVNTGDSNDSGVVFVDTSANAISVKMYDDSANTWTETAVASMTESSGASVAKGFSVSTRLSDGHTILAFWNQTDNTAADLEVWDLTLNSIAAPTVTAKTNVLTNTGEGGGVSIFIDQSNDDLYVTYTKGTAWASAVSVYYKKSTDDGSTWGSETRLTRQIEEDFRTVGETAMGAASSGGRFMPGYFDEDDNLLYGSYANSISIAAAGVGGDPPFDEGTPLLAISEAERFLNQKFAEQLFGALDEQSGVPWAPLTVSFNRDIPSVLADLTSQPPDIEDDGSGLIARAFQPNAEFPPALIPATQQGYLTVMSSLRSIASVLIDLTSITPPLEDEGSTNTALRLKWRENPPFPAELMATLDVLINLPAVPGQGSISTVLADLTSQPPDIEDQGLAFLHRPVEPEELAQDLRPATEQGWAPLASQVNNSTTVLSDLTSIPAGDDPEAIRRAYELERTRWVHFPVTAIPQLDTFIPPQPVSSTRTISGVEIDLTSVLPETGEHDVWDVVQREAKLADGRRMLQLDVMKATEHQFNPPSGAATPISPTLTISAVQIDLEHWAVSAEGETFVADLGVVTWTAEEDDLVAGITFIKDSDSNP